VRPITPPSEWVRGLVGAVKAYERLTLRAAAEPTRETLLAALTAHPLVADVPSAITLLDKARAAGVEIVAGAA
jgi:6-phospho-beta-glucosidase